jgi:hypothetical protein
VTAISTSAAAEPSPRRRRPGCLAGGILGGLAGLAFASSMLTILLAVGIWPGEAKLTAPLLCPDDRPDAFVVADTYSVQPGETTTNFTLYCVGERGDFTDAGFMRPMLLLTAMHAVLILLLVFVVGGLLGARKRRKMTPLHGGATQTATPLASDVTTPSSSPVIDNPIDPDGPITL